MTTKNRKPAAKRQSELSTESRKLAAASLRPSVNAAVVIGAFTKPTFEMCIRDRAEARLQALTARIRPHFLFNSLNAVLSLIRAEPERAETALEDLADLYRALMRDHRDLLPLRCV